jgi:glycosyltransferase involved in cell wall biosynthesis
MRVVLSAVGRFHTFDLARQLQNRGELTRVFTGTPRWWLRAERLPREAVSTRPSWYLAHKLVGRAADGSRLHREVFWRALESVDAFAAENMPACDVYDALSGTGLASGRVARERGARVVCDRGSTHIRFQDRVLAEEFERAGFAYQPIDPRIVAKEEAEYAAADVITVPSSFALASFAAQGVAREKLRLLPYGVDLGRFHRSGEPAVGAFDVLFAGTVSLRKGVPTLLEAFARVAHARKRLVLCGALDPQGEELRRRSSSAQVEFRGGLPQAELAREMSRSHVLVLPSVEDGFGLVMAQALACGCPVIASRSTGAEDLFEDGVEGFIVPPRDPDALAQRLQQLADDPERRRTMSEAALARIASIGGWDTYGDRAMRIFKELTGSR